MRATLLLLGLLALLPLAPAAAAQGCLGPHLFTCDVTVGPASAGYDVDTRWWPIEAEWYHCVQTDPVPALERVTCQYYVLA